MSARFVQSLGLAAMAALLTACGSNTPSSGSFKPTGRFGGEARPSSGATPSTAVPPSGLSPQQVTETVLARYREYQKTYQVAYETGNPSSLNSVAIDPLLTQVTKDVNETRIKGEIWRFTNILNPKIKGHSKDNSIIVITDCIRTMNAYRFSAKTGKRLGSYRGGTYIYESIMKYVDGTWKISNAKRGRKC